MVARVVTDKLAHYMEQAVGKFGVCTLTFTCPFVGFVDLCSLLTAMAEVFTNWTRDHTAIKRVVSGISGGSGPILATLFGYPLPNPVNSAQ
jgi:hypothetical protein